MTTLDMTHESKVSQDRIRELEAALRHAQEAIFWHDAKDFEMDGETIEEVLKRVLP